MIRAEGGVRVERPAEEASDFIADLSNEPAFNPAASDIVKQTDGPIGVGTVYTEHVKPLGRFETRIDVYERPTLLGFDATNPRADVRVRFHFEPDGGATTIRAEIEFEPKGALRIATPLLRPMIMREYERKRAPKLKQAIESQPAGGT